MPRSSLPRALALLLLMAVVPLLGCGDLGTSADETTFDETAYRQELEEWQANRQSGMSNPDGWRALVGLDWLEPGETSVGGAADNDVVLPTDNAPPRLGTFTVVTDAENATRDVRFHPAEGVEVTVGGEPVTGEIALATDMDEDTTVLEAGSLTMHVIEREDDSGSRLALRSRDRKHPRLQEPPELSFFPVDPAWRLAARFEPYDPPRRIPIVNVLGMVAEEPCPGALVFEQDGAEHRIDVLESGDEFFLIFGDETNCEGTYCAGRYLYTARPEAAGTGEALLDFNRAYNPPCVFTDFATCPLPPPQNKLTLAVTAGERYEKGYAPNHP